MRLNRNLIAGIGDSAWTAILTLAVIPLYLKFLGVEAYGLIGFFVTLQSIFLLLDLGLAPTINREVARCTASGNMQDARNLLHTLSVLYWCMAGLIALLMFLLSPYIAKYWINAESLSEETLVQALMLMGFVIACRWPIGLYKGAVMGAQRLTVSSAVNIVMITISNVGVVGILAFVSPTIEAFFIWQAFVGLLYAVVIRFVAWRVIGMNSQIKFDVNGLKRIWRFSAGMVGISLSAVILMQLDKALLSKLLGLEEFGGYVLAGVLASGLYVLLTPVFNTIFPRMSLLVANDDIETLVEYYRLGTCLLTATLFPIAITAAFFSQELVHLWTGNLALATNIAPVVSLLLIGTAINGAMHFPYAAQLAHGITRLPLIINAVLLVILIPLIFFLANKYGAVGGALAWLILNVIYLFLGTWLTHRLLLRGIAIKWLLRDVLVPMILSVIVIGAASSVVLDLPYADYIKLLISGGLAVLATAVIILASPRLRPMAWGKFVNITS